MKISEVAALTGMDISTIRFYERKDLIHPARTEENAYRDYAEEDVQRLKQIMLCRKIDMSIEDIHLFLDGEKSMSELLARQIEVLESRQAQVENSLELCKKMRKDEANGRTDVDSYLSYVAEEEQHGQSFPDLLPLLDEIAESTDLPRMIGYPMTDRIMQHTWLRRMLGAAIVAVLVVFPIWMMAEHLVLFVSGEYSAVRLVGLGLTAVLMLSGFVEIVKRQRKN